MNIEKLLSTVKKLKLFGTVAALFFVAMFASSGVYALASPTLRIIAGIVLPFAVYWLAVTVINAHPLEKLDDGK